MDEEHVNIFPKRQLHETKGRRGTTKCSVAQLFCGKFLGVNEDYYSSFVFHFRLFPAHPRYVNIPASTIELFEEALCMGNTKRVMFASFFKSFLETIYILPQAAWDHVPREYIILLDPPQFKSIFLNT